MASEDWRRLRPTPEQYRNFGEHLCRAHSWYKHLPLMAGRPFVVFVAPDAGSGQLIGVIQESSAETGTLISLVPHPDGPDFTEAHPRLHYAWRTTKEYRTRFGCLDYSCYQDAVGLYDRDAGPAVRLPAQLVERCGFVLYPYVSGTGTLLNTDLSGTFAEAITWRMHQRALQQLRSGAVHPGRDLVLELAPLAKAHQAAWRALTGAEHEWMYSRGTEDPLPLSGDASAELRTFLDLDERVREISTALEAQEVEKIHRALAALDDWLLEGE